MAKRFLSKIGSRFAILAVGPWLAALPLSLGVVVACSSPDDLPNGDGANDGSASGGTGSGGTGSGAAPSAGGGLGLAGSSSACEPASDSCDLATGLQHGCERRFALGINYAWREFATDFGGLTAWSLDGVAANSAAYATDLADMKAHGVTAVRWWIFPDFRGDGVAFDGSGDPSGLGGTATADILEALALADQNDLNLVFTIFSFDAFRPDADLDDSAVTVLARSIAPMVSDAGRRAKLIDNVVRPLARAVAGSPHADRLLGWDVVNEPEWAVEASTPGAPSGGAFTPNAELTAVSLSNMKALISEATDALHAELPGTLVSVGWAAAKWQWAFADSNTLDFHQPHIYGWVDAKWPYTKTPAELGYGDKPTVMGEYYLMATPFSDAGDNASYQDINESWFENGYAGAWSWQYTENKANLSLLQSFANGKGCQVSY